MNPWAWNGANPYRGTAFQVLGLSPAVTGRASIKAQVQKRRQRVRNAPERFPLFGELLDEARINEAEAAISKPEGRIYAELCTHRPRVASADVGDLAHAVAEVPVSPLTVEYHLDLARLAALAPRPRRRELKPLIEW